MPSSQQADKVDFTSLSSARVITWHMTLLHIQTIEIVQSSVFGTSRNFPEKNLAIASALDGKNR